ncbi:MAG: polysaccharide deacetylase family protein, partial [Eubacteriales bacterium]|nr:polysaccharide deacetylase family protein [Eubacteriales bacterium]
MKKRLWTLLTAALLAAALACGALAQEGGETAFYDSLPPALCVTQETIETEAQKNVFVRHTYPDTAQDPVDAQMRALIDGMAEKGMAYLPEARPLEAAYLDAGAVITRSGTGIMSFLALCEVSNDREQLYTAFETRVYDMESGEQVMLTDVFPAKSEAWALLRSEAQKQLRAAFPGREIDEAALAALLDGEAIKAAPFTLGAARLTLSFHAGDLFPGQQTLLHVHLPYGDIRGLMTPRFQAQTDNSRYKMVALTFDDGGARGSTRKVLDVLRRSGAQATFFVIGRNLSKNHDILARQQNSGYSIQSHTYNHKYTKELSRKKAMDEKELFAAELAQITGLEPTMMRSPGGDDDFYVEKEIGYPIIHWSLASGDSGNKHVDKITKRVLLNVGDGDIVLMHDINSLCHQYAGRVIDELNRQGYLMVTVEELFAHKGVPLESNKVYFSPDRVE